MKNYKNYYFITNMLWFYFMITLQLRNIHQHNPVHSTLTPIWLQEERLIQLGPIETCRDLFLLTVIAESANNLLQLMHDISDIEKDSFTFSYNILGTLITVKPFRLESDNTYLNEKVVVKIRSSLGVLVHYLNLKPHIFVKLKKDNTIIAQSEVSIKSLITVNSQEDFKTSKKNASFTSNYCCVLHRAYSKNQKLVFENGKYN